MRIRDSQALGAFIRDRRKSIGWSQTELAERIGASRSWVSDTENGKESAEIGLVLRALHALGLGVNVRDAYDVVSPHDRDDRRAARPPDGASSVGNPTGGSRSNNPPARGSNRPSHSGSSSNRPPLTRRGRPLSHHRNQSS